MFQRIIRTGNSGAIVLIRLMVGVVFLSEGIQKFLFPALRGAGRFESIGLPSPGFLGPFVGAFEITCGILILLGLVTRLASVPLITIMIVAITTTKIPILASDGLWQMLHAGRTDLAMLMGSLFLLLKGGGRWSVDQILMRRGI
jgi:putative oxidoreductase